MMWIVPLRFAISCALASSVVIVPPESAAPSSSIGIAVMCPPTPAVLVSAS
jgi:hypothetical protein